MKYEGMMRPKAKAKEPSLDTGRDENRITRVRKTYVELIQQPDSFFSTVDYTLHNLDKFISDLSQRKVSRVVLIGCGDSWFVGTCLEHLIEKLMGVPCQSFDAFECSTSKWETMNNETVIIGQSASGTTGCVLDALCKASEKGAYTVGLSNTENATILKQSDFGLLVQAKREGWPTQATTSAIGAIACLFASLCINKGQNVDYARTVLSELRNEIPTKIKKAISENENIIKKNICQFKNNIFFQATGNGPMFGAAQVACAKLRELCPVHASNYPLEEFHHYRTAKPEDPVIILMNDDLSRNREIDTALVGAYDGGKIIVIGTNIPEEIKPVTDLFCVVPATIPELQNIVSMTVCHLFAYYLAECKYENNIGYPSEEK